MMKIELSEKESAVLIDILESSLADLRTERVGTDNRLWHAELKEREVFLGNLIKQLEDQRGVAAT